MISIIVPTYNRCMLLQQTIDSALAQTYRDFEVIVVDDGSTDETPQVIPARYGDRIHYVWQENAGESTARNHGINLAHGEFIAFLDSDDLWLPQKLEKQAVILDTDPKVGGVFTQAYYIDSDNHPAFGGRIIGADITPEDLTWQKQFFRAIPCGGSTALIRKDIFISMGGFREDIRYGEDAEVWLRIATRHPLAWVAEPLAKIRTHVGAQGKILSSEIVKSKYRDRIAILESIDLLTDRTLDRKSVSCFYAHLNLLYALQAIAISDIPLAKEILGGIQPGSIVKEEDLEDPLLTSIPYLISGRDAQFAENAYQVLRSNPIVRPFVQENTRCRLKLLNAYGNSRQMRFPDRITTVMGLLWHCPSLMMDKPFRFLLKSIAFGG